MKRASSALLSGRMRKGLSRIESALMRFLKKSGVLTRDRPIIRLNSRRRLEAPLQ
jgi:hypothetical protein